MEILAKISFSESDKKITIILLFLLLFIILIAGYLQKLVGFIMRKQGLKIDTLMYDILKTKTIDDKKTFKKEAYRKSNVYFCLKAYIPFLGILISVLAILIYGWAKKDPGMTYYSKINDLFYQLNWPTTKFFNLTIISDWPKVIKSPDFSWNIDKYYSLFFTILGGCFALVFLFQVQGYLSRCLRIRQLARNYFTKELVNESTNKQI